VVALTFVAGSIAKRQSLLRDPDDPLAANHDGPATPDGTRWCDDGPDPFWEETA
jgi:hypothetical protein